MALYRKHFIMRILIDSTQIPRGRTGVGIYAEHLIHELALILRPEDNIFVLVQSDDQSMLGLIAGHANLTPVIINSSVFRNRLALAIHEQFAMPWILRRYRIDLIHSLHYTFPLLSSCSRVVTLHDMTFFLWPDMHTRGRQLIMSFFAKLALRHAEGVLFVSDSTRKDAEKLFGPGNNIRRVTPLGVDQALFSSTGSTDARESLSKLGINQPYILFLGTVEPRKNVLRLVQAFESVSDRHPNHILVIAGGLGWNFEETLQAIEHSSVKKRILRLGYVLPEDKISLLSCCDLLAYPSLYEGFGLPVLEAMAAGVPVITSNVSSLPEIAGDAAVQINPLSVELMAAAISWILEDNTYRNKLRQAGKEQAKKFSWRTTARHTYAAYRQVMGDPLG